MKVKSPEKIKIEIKITMRKQISQIYISYILIKKKEIIEFNYCSTIVVNLKKTKVININKGAMNE